LPQPHHLAAASQNAKVVTAARRYAAFWNTGDASYAQAALAPDFIDRTLPAGRPQGPTGPLAASQAFRKAVPDLRAEIDEMVVFGDRVSVHLHFHGHFSGQFGNVQGQGPRAGIDDDSVAIADRRNRTAACRLRRDVPDQDAM